MNLQQTAASLFPRSLRFILASVVPVALACNYLSQLHDARPAPETMTAAAVSARLTPIAHVLPVLDDTKVAASGQGAVANN
jgi:hypothetical protein